MLFGNIKMRSITLKKLPRSHIIITFLYFTPRTIQLLFEILLDKRSLFLTYFHVVINESTNVYIFDTTLLKMLLILVKFSEIISTTKEIKTKPFS